MVIPLFLFLNTKTERMNKKNEKEENLMERSIRPHRNRTRYYGVYKRIRSARTDGGSFYCMVCLGDYPISCPLCFSKARETSGAENTQALRGRRKASECFIGRRNRHRTSSTRESPYYRTPANGLSRCNLGVARG